MLREFCAENHEQISRAIALGAGRIELCDNLAVGGTTPSYGVIKYTCQLAQEQAVPVMCMIRPRGGNFVYDQMEVDMMLEDIVVARELGASGVVFGALDESNWLAEDVLLQLLHAAQGLEITFHMAFDAIPRSRQFEAIDWLAAHGVSRILTHGALAGTPIEENVDWLKELIHHAKGKLTILPGGGVTVKNYQTISQYLGVEEVHGTRICW